MILMDQKYTFQDLKQRVVIAIAEANDVSITAVHIYVAQERCGYSILELDKINP